MRNARELQTAAWEALVKGLGLADALRYRVLFEPGHGDYAAEREALFRDMSLDDWVEAVRRRDTQRDADTARVGSLRGAAHVEDQRPPAGRSSSARGCRAPRRASSGAPCESRPDVACSFLHARTRSQMGIIDWRDRIAVDPAVHHGDPCIRGTRVPVSVVVGSVADGDTIEAILAEYPALSRDDVFAALRFAAEAVGGFDSVPLHKGL
ncbi:MAG TPA: DUF433 domain-containing protein [Polyangia bacterium]|jgi:uncharacterized protein (DUF433 family)